MISLVVTADTKNYNPAERDLAFSALLAKYKEPFEIVYVANADYPYLDELRKIASGNDRKLVVTAPTTNINTQIYTALDYTDNGDVLLATLDTNLALIQKIIEKHREGADLVFVKQQENWFKNMFIALGRATYQLGLKILGRGHDMCCDARVLFLNNRSVNTIILNPTLSKALRLVNPDPDKTSRILDEKVIYDNPTPTQKGANNSFMSLGIVSLFYIIALLVLAIVFPLCNSGVYTVWILVALILWLVLGIIGCVVVAKFIYNTRLGLPVAINLAGEPIINITEVVASEYQTVFDENEPITTPNTAFADEIDENESENVDVDVVNLDETIVDLDNTETAENDTKSAQNETKDAKTSAKAKQSATSKAKITSSKARAQSETDTLNIAETENTTKKAENTSSDAKTESAKTTKKATQSPSTAKKTTTNKKTTKSSTKTTTKKASATKTTAKKSTKTGAKKPKVSVRNRTSN